VVVLHGKKSCDQRGKLHYRKEMFPTKLSQ